MSGQKNRRWIWVQPSVFIKDVIKFIRASLPATVEIQVDIRLDNCSIYISDTGFHQILVNLCTNAFHAMKDEKGTIEIKLAEVDLKAPDLVYRSEVSEGRFAELIVSDNGHGMSRSIRDRIFDPYFTTKEVGRGTGMGLALVHGIVCGCGGFIEVESEPGEGTTFRVYIPVINLEHEETEESEELLPSGNHRILAVDDEKAIADMYKLALEGLGYEVTACYCSRKAIEIFQSSPDRYDLVITDQAMPHLSGHELADKILQIRPDIPIILCTGFSSRITKEKAEAIGFKAFLMKPVRKRDIAVAVWEVMKKDE